MRHLERRIILLITTSVYVASQFAGSPGLFAYNLHAINGAKLDVPPIGQPPEENGYDCLHVSRAAVMIKIRLGFYGQNSESG